MKFLKRIAAKLRGELTPDDIQPGDMVIGATMTTETASETIPVITDEMKKAIKDMVPTITVPAPTDEMKKAIKDMVPKTTREIARKKKNDYQRRIYQDKIKQGLCTYGSCDARAEDEKRMCREHQTKVKKYPSRNKN